MRTGPTMACAAQRAAGARVAAAHAAGRWLTSPHPTRVQVVKALSRSAGDLKQLATGGAVSNTNGSSSSYAMAPSGNGELRRCWGTVGRGAVSFASPWHGQKRHSRSAAPLSSGLRFALMRGFCFGPGLGPSGRELAGHRDAVAAQLGPGCAPVRGALALCQCCCKLPCACPAA